MAKVNIAGYFLLVFGIGMFAGNYLKVEYGEIVLASVAGVILIIGVILKQWNWNDKKDTP